MKAEDIEQRFQEISGIVCNYAKFPLNPSDIKTSIQICS